MDQPVFWGTLAATAAVAMGLRLVAARPLWRRHARALTPWELAVAGVMVAALVFHCAAMFFADWVDAVPFADKPAASVRDLGPASQAAYWLPAVGLVIALRRVWPPALGLLVVTLVGVGFTMFVPYSLTTHLAWIAAATITLVMIAMVFLSGRGWGGAGGSLTTVRRHDPRPRRGESLPSAGEATRVERA